MLVQRFDRLLARTDPFDLAQAIEAHVRSLSPARLRGVIREARPRMNAYYLSELDRILKEPEASRPAALVAFLKSNLRAIPLFPPAFAAAILDRVPSQGAVAMGEETPSRAMRAAVLAGAALALVVAGAAGEHIVANARMAAQTPAPFAMVPPPAELPPPTATPSSRPATPRPATPRPATAVPTPAPTPPPQTPQPAAVPPPAAAEPVPTAPRRSPTPAPTPSGGQGVATITAAPATPSPEPSDLDTSDMPEAYSDATPLPQQSANVATAPQHGIRVVTPKPSPRRQSWLHRAIMHLDPFKPHPKPT